MKIIPAIDIQNGNCVRLKQGDFTKETIFHSSPIDMAQKWVDEGAERLHIVDLDGARLGSPINMAVISKICDKFPSIPVQIGGGIRDLETAEKYLSAGASFIIVGTKAVEDPNFIKILCSKFPKKVIVGIDAKNGEVATEGWLSISDKNAIDFAKIFENLGVAEIVYTDIEKDGMMKGLNIEATLDLAKNVKIPIIASGGVSCIEDIYKIGAYTKSGISGIIIGRALYEKKFNIEEAKKVFDE
ncbi:MAG: 1-(5-phosphoribosyl)-5-[(5-phosphoribosylamino)methylideneamino]imidazole-4-carboxamide isomerase [Gammaproteobacteria bacterium]|jgi:phosphoribosylformimino-5-aminoimidazole carboxamide ribotide isomerase|nr:1-(5-phosphoribosyl)-5-[(5-phosphoribosylamino)methylideneamino]imidazole-4-carboxamide isomerase [Gammaproteobacteria bacterium]|tara:strand:- start:1302 stop:2030 length:729 start_codon:yes stop_codon:yes gene_type:complete